MRFWDSLDKAMLPSLSFDESSSLLTFASPIGIKTVSVSTGKVLRIFGKGEQQDHYLQVVVF